MTNYILHNWLRIQKDFVPTKYGMLYTIGPAFTVRSSYPSARGTEYNRRITWQVCQCDCGDIGIYMLGHIRCGHTTSCGCAQKEAVSRKQRKHGNAGTAEYDSWYLMIRRCYRNDTKTYSRYAGRGITVCARWREPNGQGLLNFIADMGRKPSPKHTIDRYPDPDGNYEPGNCRWATPEEQANNRKNTVLLTYRGETKGLAQFARQFGVEVERFRYYLNTGLDMEQVLLRLGVAIND